MALEDYIKMQEKFYNLRIKEFANIPQLCIQNKSDTRLKYLELINIDGWMLEISNLSYEVEVCLASSIAYDKLMRQYPNYGELELQKLIYLKVVLNNLFSFRDKIGYLFYELLGRKVTEFDKRKKEYVKVKYNRINFMKILIYLKRIKYKEIQELKYLSEDEFNCVKNYFNHLEQIGMKINPIRNKLVHACCIPIDSFGTGIFRKTTQPKNFGETAYQYITVAADQYCFLQDVKEEFVKYRNVEWVEIGELQEKTMGYEEIVQNIIKMWEKYCEYTEKVIKNIEILKKYTVID